MTGRLAVAEGQLAQRPGAGMGNGGEKSAVFDVKRLYPRELKESTAFRSWAERFISWVSMDSEEIGKAFDRAAKQPDKLDVSGLTSIQTAYSKAIYNHLRCLTENHKKAAKIVRLVKGGNGLEAWRRLVRRFDPQNPEVHAAQLERIVTFGARHAVKNIGDVETKLAQFERVLADSRM